MGATAQKFVVFVSYSRSDEAFAKKVVEGLERHGLTVTIDTRDLPFGEKWQKELAGFIKGADAIVYIVSPRSVASHWCKWELAQVAAQSKRLVPVVREPVPLENLPPEISEIHLFPWSETHADEDRAALLAPVLLTDRDWVKEHSRLGDLAATWTSNERSNDRLLRGQALESAERWAQRRPASAPAPSSEHLAFISASQSAAKRRARQWRTGISTVAIGALALAGLAFWQRQEAKAQRDEALTVQSRFLADQSREYDRKGLRTQALLIGLEALPDPEERDAVRSSRPYEPRAEAALYSIWQQSGKLKSEPIAELPQEFVAWRVGVSPAAKLVATTDSYDVRLWDAATMQARHLLKVGWLSPPFALSPDGARILASGKVFDTITGVLLGSVTGEIITSVAYSPDGKLLATGTHEGKLQLWNASTFQLAKDLPTEPKQVNGIAFSPDGKSLATVSGDRKLHIWSVEKATSTTLEGDATSNLSFSPDGTLLLGSNAQTIKLWDARSGRLLRSLAGHSNGVNSLSFNRAGTRILSGSADATVRLWDAATGAQLLVHKLDRVLSTAFMPDENSVAVGVEKGAAVLPVYDTTQRLLWAVKSSVPRCLTTDERFRGLLQQEPPAWCSGLGLWPRNGSWPSATPLVEILDRVAAIDISRRVPPAASAQCLSDPKYGPLLRMHNLVISSVSYFGQTDQGVRERIPSIGREAASAGDMLAFAKGVIGGEYKAFYEQQKLGDYVALLIDRHDRFISAFGADKGKLTSETIQERLPKADNACLEQRAINAEDSHESLHHFVYAFWNRRYKEGNAEQVLAILKWLKSVYG